MGYQNGLKLGSHLEIWHQAAIIQRIKRIARSYTLRTSLFPLMVIIFIGLLGGAAITSNGSPLPMLEQVSNPEASTTVGAGDQFQT